MPEPSEMVDVSFTLNFPEGTLRSTVPVPVGQTNLTQLLPILQNLSSGIVQYVGEAAAQHGTLIQCGPKCSACCHQLVPISPFEAEALANWIRSLPGEQQQALMGRFQQALLALQDRGVLAQLNPGMFQLSTDRWKELNGAYYAAGVPCPFLDQGNCGIHPIRPLICREYVVVTPPAYCSEPGHPRAEVVVLPVKPSKALQTLGRRVEGDAQGWLPLVFLFHWMAAGRQAGPSISGTGTEVLGEFLQAVAQAGPTTAPA
ncbi:MAG: YkgJ family cysteine cluster protein [Rhodospirillales bacterium]|nr:YkgJ family cysteine cluster protein [Acetobacter sp.]